MKQFLNDIMTLTLLLRTNYFNTGDICTKIQYVFAMFKLLGAGLSIMGNCVQNFLVAP